MPGALFEDERERMTFALLVAHYWANDGFLTNGQEIIPRIHELNGIPETSVALLSRRGSCSGDGNQVTLSSSRTRGTAALHPWRHCQMQSKILLQ